MVVAGEGGWIGVTVAPSGKPRVLSSLSSAACGLPYEEEKGVGSPANPTPYEAPVGRGH